MGHTASTRSWGGDLWAWVRRRRALLFPLALWFLAAFFLLGDLGKFNDDWFYMQREPGTGAIQSLVLDRPVHFWRPLYRVIVPALATLLWKMDWLNHLISAAAHGGVAWLLWRLMRELRVPGPPAAAGALWFLVWPSHFEPVFWSCALPMVLSTGALAGAWIVQVKLARGEWGRWALAVIPGLVLTCACLNEQATTGLAALPLLAAGAMERVNGRRAFAARALVPAVLSGAALGAYLVAHAALRYRLPAIGNVGYAAPPAELPGISWRALGWERVEYVSATYLGRAFQAGALTIGEHPARAAVVGAVLALGLWPWAAAVARQEERQGEWRRGMVVAGAGLVAWMAMFAPIVMFNYWLNPRVNYGPSMGLALVIAGVGTAAGRARLRFRGRASPARACGVLLVIPALAMVGFQRGFRDRARWDADEVGQLLALVPHPAPGSVLVPARIEPPAPTPGKGAWFDDFFWSGFSSRWSAPWMARLAYGRADLNCGFARWYESGFVRVVADRAIVRGVGSVPWERTVVFTIGADHVLHVATKVVLNRAGEVPIVIQLPQAKGLPEYEVTVPRP